MIGARVRDHDTAISPSPSISVTDPITPASPSADYLIGTIATLRPQLESWTQLASRASADPTYHPDATQAYLDALMPEAQVVTINVMREDGLIGALPLVSDRSHMMHVPVRRLRAPVLVDSPERFDILCAPDDAGPAVQSIWQALTVRDDWDVLELVALPEGGPGSRLLDLARSNGYPIGRRIVRSTPYLTLDPDASLERNVPAATTKFLANLRRRRRNLEKIGPVELVRRTSYDDGFFNQFLILEHAGWKGSNGTSILSDPAMTSYYRRLAQAAAANGTLVMYSLECAGEPVAMHLGLAAGGRYLVPKLAYSERHHAHAPGHLLIHDVLEDCLERRFTEFDFLGGEMPWKREWTDQLRIHCRAHIFNRTAAGRLAKAVRYDGAPVAKLLWQRASGKATALQSRARSRNQELTGV
jgi:CelD/BcsL family acetyltransferase involved in cellulose biosynthesis